MKCRIFRAWFAWDLVGENNPFWFWRKNVGLSTEAAESRFEASTALRPLTLQSVPADDLWVVSKTLDFELDTFVACSAFFGPSSAGEVELLPLEGYFPSSWPVNSKCRVPAVSCDTVCQQTAVPRRTVGQSPDRPSDPHAVCPGSRVCTRPPPAGPHSWLTPGLPSQMTSV